MLLRTYSGDCLPVVGEMDVWVQYGQQAQDLVVTRNSPSLLGRNWLAHIVLDWREIRAVNSHPVATLPYLLDKYNAYLLMSWAQCQIAYEADDSSKLGRYHTALRNGIEDKLDCLEHEGILEKVTHSEWATPIVAVPKPDGKVRLCGDFKVTVNQAMKVDQYPIPTAKNLCATLAGRKKFSKIDSSQAYLYRWSWTRSRKSIAPSTPIEGYISLHDFHLAPAMFQKMMDTILQGIPGTIYYMDDILVTGATEEEHLRNLEEVFRWLQAHGIRVKKGKCRFLHDSVDYMGHRRG